MRSLGFRFLIVLCFWYSSVQGQDRPYVIEIGQTAPTRLAVAPFTARSSDTQETVSTIKVFDEVLWSDLKFAGMFEMPSRSFYPLTPIRLREDVEFENWQVPSLDVDFLAFGNLQVYETAVVVEAFLFDVKTRQQVMGRRYTIADPTLIRRVAHQFADQIVFRLSAGASRGVAQTQIAYSAQKGSAKEIYVMDYDGNNVRTITANGGLNKFPEWTPDNSKLTFVTNLSSRRGWELWLQDLAGGRTVVPTPSNFVSSPAVSPDGNRLAFASREASGDNPEIFTSELNGSGRRNLTRHPAIDASPTWSPTGQQIAFISDRTGTPQLWMMDADGTNLRRLVSEGGHCDSPSWSPDGRFILYTWQAPKQWTHDIYIVEVATLRIFQLTSGAGSNENPSWSPDGRHVVFQSTRSGSRQIFIMNADGKNLKQLTAYGINGSPAWSGYFRAEE